MTPTPADAREREALIALSHRMDDAAQHITERQVYDFAEELRGLLGLDGQGARDAAMAATLATGDAVSPVEPVAWLDPATRDVITAECKVSWETDYGAGGRQRASTYTQPLYTAPPPAVEAQGWMDRLYEAIKDVMLGHRLTHTMDGEESHLPLVDALCAPSAQDIGTGRDEIVFLCDAIYNDKAVQAVLAAAPSQGGQHG